MLRETKKTRLSYSAVTLVALMLFSSWASVLASAEDSKSSAETEVSWPKSGSVDTGWMEMATSGGNDSTTNSQSYANWNLEFAPGAEISNVSLQVHVNGSDGLSIDSPLLLAQDTGDRLFDFSGYGSLGALDSFDGANPYADRLAPNSAIGAGWTLPSSATITDLTLEALAPSDPIAFFDQVDINDLHSAQHPDDGQLYLSTGNTVYVLDANSNPEIIDSFSFDGNSGDIVGIDVGPNGNIHIALSNGQFKMINRNNGTLQSGLTALGTDGLAAFEVLSSGIYVAYDNGSLYEFDLAASVWNLKASAETTTTFSGITIVNDIHEQSDIIYLATDNGVARYDSNLEQPLPRWSSNSLENVLHSDTITKIETMGTLLLFASPDSGMARLNHNSGIWLSTWDSGNSLPADSVYAMTLNQNVLHIISGDKLVRYDRSSSSFSIPVELNSINLTESSSLALIPWINIGSRSPSTDVHIVTNGNGKLMLIEANVQSRLIDEILFATGPFDSDINDVLEYNGILYGAGFFSKVVERFDLVASVWLEPIPINDYVYTLARAGNTILVGTYQDGIQLIENGVVRDTIPVGIEYGPFYSAIYDIDSTGDCSTSQGCEILYVSPYGIYTVEADSTSTSTTKLIKEELDLTYDVAIYAGVGHISTSNGVLRYDLVNNTFIDSWRSTTVNRLDYAQVAVIGDTVSMGIEGYGVARKNIITGQTLATLDSTSTAITSDNVYSVEASGSDLWIGTDSAAWIWDGTTATKVLEGGFYERPRRFYDFELDGNTMYAGTNLGLCKYSLSGTFISVPTCNAFAPIGQVTEVAVNSTTIFAGTNNGVYLIDKATLAIVDTLTTDDESKDAVVVVIDDIAYIGLSGIGVARWDITNEEWLTTWGDSVLGANGNIQITGMINDVANRGLWVAGPQFFRLVNTSTGQVSQSLAINNAHDLIMYGNTLYYHLKDTSDNIFSYDIINSTGKSPLDAGTAFGNQTGSITSMEINGDTLVASLLIVKTTPGSFFTQATTSDEGGLVQYDLANQVWNTTINSSGSIDVVSYFNSSTGHSWVSWGNTGVEVYAPNGTSIGFWDNISTVTEIVEYDGRILFATENGVQRFNETSFQWEPTWVSGNGLPGSTGNIIYELWTDGSILAVGISDGGLFVPKYYIAFLELDGTWTSYQTGTTNIPRGIPFSMIQCGTYLYTSFWNSNGGISAFDLTTLTAVRSWGGGSFPTGIENNKVSALACDDDEILYVGYNGKGNFNSDLPISRYDTQNSQWLSTISQSANGLTSDVISSDGLYHSDGMLFISTGIFGFRATSTTSFFYLQTNSSFTGQVLDAPLRTAVTSFQNTGGELHLARAGGSTGVNSILKYNASGFDTLIQYASLPSGNITSMENEGNTLWVATTGGVLKGEYNTSGGIEWMNGWSTPIAAVTTDMLLNGTELYLSTTGSGLLKLDVNTGDLVTVSGALHNNQAGLAKAVDSSGTEELIIGLLGSATTASGVQTFDLTSQQFTTSSLLAGLPSNVIQGLTLSSDSLFIATSNGVGHWNLTQNAWELPITRESGLSDSSIQDVLWDSNLLYLASLSGFTQYNPSTGAITILKVGDGLLGNSVASIGRYNTVNQGTWLIPVHDGALGERPGLSVIDISSNAVVSTHRFDQLPSNVVTSVTADYGGVHIATDIGPLTHYNGLTDQFIAGVSRSDVPSWPIRDMESDGVHLILRGSSSISIVEARNTSHTLLKSFVVPNPQNVAVGPTGFWLASRDDGLFGWNKAFEVIEDGQARSADPLFASIDGQVFNIGNMAHPGYEIQLINSENPLILNSSQGSIDTNGASFQYIPLALSSPDSNTPVWAKTVLLNYDAEIDISDTASLAEMLQFAIDNGQIINRTRYVPLKLLSQEDGSMEIRLTYDWVRKDTPVVITDVYDRPDDGGSALSFEWSIVTDIDFKAYHIYVNEGPWNELVSEISFEGRIPDASKLSYTSTVAVTTTANGEPIIDGTEYYAVIVVEYQDGRYGVPSPIAGPLVTSDEVPIPPAWATAVPFEDSQQGELSLEWARCTALDIAQTGIYLLESFNNNEVTLNMIPDLAVPVSGGNTTILNVETGIIYWLGFTCIDAGGKEDTENATIIGPVIAPGGDDNGLPPAPLNNVFAIDTPEDSGGKITLGWDQSSANDCAFYQIFMVTDVEFSTEPTSVDGFTASKIITDCSVNSTILSDFDGTPLVDGQAYYIGVVAFDEYLNSQRTGVEIVTATPLDNLNDDILPPERIASIVVFDTPNDQGTAIDITWLVSESDEFGYYTVWIGDRPLDNVASLWDEYGTNPDTCGCIVIDKQSDDEDKNQITLTARTGLYYSTDVSGNTINMPSLIRSNTKLYVAVSVHNSDGDAYLTELQSPSVTPINNLQDDIAPQRIDNLTLQDRPQDDGTGVNLEFELSTASDISEYQIYAASYKFTNVGALFNGPSSPVMVTESLPEFPLTISLLEGETPISPELTVWVAVVPVDFSGNSITTNLITASVQSIDNGFANDGSNLPSVEGITLSWIDSQKILVSWNQITTGDVQGFQVHIAAKEFSEITEAELVGDQISSASFIITNDNYELLSNTSNWFVSVTPFDDENIKQVVRSVEINASQAPPSGNNNDALSLESVLSARNLIIAGIALTTLITIVILSISRRGRSDLSNAWEIQDSTWGIEGQSQYGEMTSPVQSPPRQISPDYLPQTNTKPGMLTLPPLPAGMVPPAIPLPPLPQLVKPTPNQYTQPLVQQPVQPTLDQYTQPLVQQSVQPTPDQYTQTPNQQSNLGQQQPNYNDTEVDVKDNQTPSNIDVSFLDELL